MKIEKQPYSQTKALWAITRASFKAIFANPSAIIFSILFPIIFILIFGAFGLTEMTSFLGKTILKKSFYLNNHCLTETAISNLEKQKD